MGEEFQLTMGGVKNWEGLMAGVFKLESTSLARQNWESNRPKCHRGYWSQRGTQPVRGV